MFMSLAPVMESRESYLQMMNKYTTKYTYPELLRQATDEAGNLNAIARRTGISRRRLGKIKAGSPMSSPEIRILQLLADRKLA
jgi:DNA-binding phage protein